MKKILLAFSALLLSLTEMNAAVITVSGDIASNTTWSNNNIYLLTGFVYVTNNSTLTIQPGTIIEGDQATKGALIITRGSKIQAIGTVSQPIVFTSNQPAGFRSYGDWGGLILCGSAPVNDPAGERLIEGGVDAVKGLYGGANPTDNSGTLKYVRIEFAGIAFLPNNEVNGLTCGGVGSGTTIEYVQVSYTGDDAFEWFGGTVNAKHLISLRNWDDDFDTDYGYSGKIQFGVVLRDSTIADQSGSNGFESDNDANGSTNSPYTKPIFSNISVFGPKITANTTINSNYKRALHLRRSTKTCTYNSVFSGYPVGLKIENANTATNVTNNELQFKNNIIAGCAIPLDSSALNFGMATWFSSNGNIKLPNSTDLMAVSPYNYTGPNFSPGNNSPMSSGADFSSPNLNDPFFDVVTYKGAFNYTNWTSCWSSYDPQYEPYNGAIDYITQPLVTAGGATTFCQGGSVTLTSTASASYLWSNGATTQAIVVSTSGSYSVICTNTRGCTATSAATTVVVNPLPTATITAGGPTTFCTGDSVILTSSVGSSYLWSNGATTQSTTIYTSGNYTVTVTDANTCSAISAATTVSASQSPVPTVTPGGPIAICQGASVVLTSSVADTYLWSPGGQTTQSITVTQAGNYHVTATNSNPCNGVGASADVAITVNPLPTASFTYGSNGVTYVFTNTSTGATTYSWDFGDFSNSAVTSPVHNYASNGVYKVLLTAYTAANCSDTVSEWIPFLVGINENKTNTSIQTAKLYPNPNKGTTTLELEVSQNNTQTSIHIFDLTGKVVYNEIATLNEGTQMIAIDTQSYNEGIYYVRVTTDSEVKIVKMVVQK